MKSRGLLTINLILMLFMQLLIGPLILQPLYAQQINNQFNAYLINNLPIIADLDGDQNLDIAELISQGNFKTIQIKFNNQKRLAFSFNTKKTVSGNLIITDIDQDRDLDIVWYSKVEPNLSQIWYSDGKGAFIHNSSINANDLKLLTALNNDDNDSLSYNAKSTKPSLLLAKQILYKHLLNPLKLAPPTRAVTNIYATSISIVNLLVSPNLQNRAPPTGPQI